MSIYANNLKRKFEDNEDNDAVRATKEAKKGPSLSEVGPSYGNTLVLHRLSPKDWVSTANFKAEKGGESTVEECTKGRSVSRGISWTGIDDISQIHRASTQMSLSCSRFPNRESSYDCETQTYYFMPKPVCDIASTSSASVGREKRKKGPYGEDNILRACCVQDCESWSAEHDSSVTFYTLPSSNTEKSHWADILKVEFVDAPEHAVQEICSRHFIANASQPPRTYKTSSAVPKSSSIPKSRMKKKKTCDVLIAEEAEKVKQSMATGRPKRTPKPNRNYDWAEVIPLIKNEADDLEEVEMPVAKTPVKLLSGQGRRRKQLLGDVKREKENEEPFVELHLGLTGVAESEVGPEDYGADISLPSMPRAPPPKPKGRPPRIQDTCTQTYEGLCSNRGPLREVKVQCNLTAEPLITCSSCSNVDWKRLDEQLSGVVSVVEGDLCNPVVSKCLRKVLSLITVPSHATNVMKMIAGIERDVLESAKGKDIVLVSSQDEWEEVEIENVIHQEEAPISGVREITPKVWNKRTKVTREMRLRDEESTVDDPDSLGLREATDKDDEEFKPDLAELELEEDEEDVGELDDDDDWDINNEDESGVPIQKKKKARQKTKKELNQEAGSLNQGCRIKDNTRCSSHIGREKRVRASKFYSKVHKSKNPLICQICDEIFKNSHEVQIHVKQVHEKKSLWFSEYRKAVSYQCKDCDNIYCDKVSLSAHRMFKHGDPRRYQCDQCDYEAPRLYHLKRHFKVHSDEREYLCAECGKGFKLKQAYKNHMTLHTNEGRYRCNICNKAYNNKGVYEDHMRSHGTEREFACKYCGFAVKTYKQLASHVRGVHLNDKRFICDICGAKYMSGTHLRTHMKTHTDIESLSYSHHCSICDSVFRGSKGLTSHMKVMHEMLVTDNRDELSDIKIMTPHPTRRSVKIEYNKVKNIQTGN